VLVDHAQLTAGQHVLGPGWRRGRGSFVVQIAASLGAKVTATASANDRAFVTELGATTVIDLVGGQTQTRSGKCCGTAETLVGIAAPPSPRDVKRHVADGVFFIVTPDRAQLRELTRLIDEHRLRPIVDRVVSREQTCIAYRCTNMSTPAARSSLRCLNSNDTRYCPVRRFKPVQYTHADVRHELMCSGNTR
jgi:NADPH:quinone reductase-like Zn-dependent oxidoreductase